MCPRLAYSVSRVKPYAKEQTISHNGADFDGGGIYNAGTLTVSGSTIPDNS